VDVLSVEPANPRNPLLFAPNCIITPHIAWAPKETRQRLIDTAVSNLRAYLSGTPENVVF
jgi:glycerate dehydrogenase